MNPKENLLHSSIKKLAAKRFNSRWLAGILHRLDMPVIRLSKGRFSLSSLLTGSPFLVLTVKGAKTGIQRTLPLFCFESEGKIALIGTNFGRKNHPAWVYNLLANPEAEVLYRGQQLRLTARMSTEAEHQFFWQQALKTYHGYANYAQWASHRQIPIFILE